MPLFKWKKTRRYEVSSRNSYVVCVHLLDTTLIECTLTADSCGYECLENIAQRIELNQLEYFGLRYVNKKLQFRWVELDKPLKRQLDKHAHSPLLYFGVMYYVPDAQRIHDDMTRYQYYLQLKSDVIDGKIPCSSEKAVLLAAYSVQAELGDYDFERHTVDNLKDIVLLPRNMTVDDRSLVELTQDIINNHQTLVGWSAATAEVEYILEAQQLEGYGMDYYSAKDSSGLEVLLGAYYQGIFMKVLNAEQHTDQYKWSEISQTSYNKKHFIVSTPLREKPVHFTLDDPDTAKYIHKLFSLQMKFYTGRSVADPSDTDPSVGSRTPDLAESHVEGNLSHNSAALEAGEASPASLPSMGARTIQYEAPAYDSTPAPEDPGITVLNTPSAIATAGNTLYYSNGNIFTVGESGSQQQLQQPPATPLQQHIAPSAQYQAAVPYTSNPYLNATPVPPSYRHTPDYETVMHQRMEQMAAQQHAGQLQAAITHGNITPGNMDPTTAQLAYLSNIMNNQVYTHPEIMAYSQPEINHMHSTQGSHVNPYHMGGMDITTGIPNGSVFPAVMDCTPHYPLRPVDRTSSLIIYPTYATPDLNKSSLPTNYSTSEHMLNVAYQYKPPPPYPRPSNSTPDLASQTMRSNRSTSPDLISRRHLQDNGLMVQSFLDQSVENLAADTQKITLSQQHAALSKQNLDDTSSIHSEAISQRLTYSGSIPTHSGSIPDVAHQAMLSQDYAVGGAYTNPSFSSAHPIITPQSSIETPPSGGRSSSRSLPQPTMLNVAGQHLPPEYPYSMDFNSFDNPAYKDNLPYYLGETQISLNPSEVNPAQPVASSVELTNQTTESQPSVPLVTKGQTAEGVIFRKKKQRPSSAVDHTDSAHLKTDDEERTEKRLSMGALKMAALNGLTLSRGSVLDTDDTDSPGEETPRLPKDERRKQLEAKLEAGQVFVEFEKVHKKRLKYECGAASQQINKERNRFKDVLPYDDNRVKLTPTKENPMGYINASNITLRIGQEELWYVATQGPVTNTIHDFWQMVWEQEVEVIAMLTKLQEHGKQKCHRYWPERVGVKHKIQHAQYQIVMKFSNNSGPYTTSGLMVKHLPSNRERLVWHLQYTDWPDHGCPQDVQGFLAFLDETEAVKRQTQMEKKDARRVPILAHCSAGVGRTGVVILTEAIKACLEYNEDVDVPGTLAKLREQRMYTVQTVSQYSFVYKTLIEYLKGSRLI